MQVIKKDMNATNEYTLYKTGENDCTTDDGLWKQLRGDAGQFYCWRRFEGTSLFDRIIGGIDDEDKLDSHDGTLPDVNRRGGTPRGTPKDTKVNKLVVVHDHGKVNLAAQELEFKAHEEALLNSLVTRERDLNTSRSAPNTSPDSKKYYGEERNAVREQIRVIKLKIESDRDARDNNVNEMANEHDK